ncbi:hypothetical protein ACFP2T_43355 [Plantactinospora solaniradicis]|uniref:Uncharacterized protein n=1 Tax=Plantactinospora solaniradicis TaxID=1723736 RepID=A0ABW1KMC0_9ACTN
MDYKQEAAATALGQQFRVGPLRLAARHVGVRYAGEMRKAELARELARNDWDVPRVREFLASQQRGNRVVKVPESVTGALRWKYSGLFDPFPPEKQDRISQWRNHAEWFASGYLAGKGFPFEREAREEEATLFGYAYGIHVIVRQETPFHIEDCWRMWTEGDAMWIGIAF